MRFLRINQTWEYYNSKNLSKFLIKPHGNSYILGHLDSKHHIHMNLDENDNVDSPYQTLPKWLKSTLKTTPFQFTCGLHLKWLESTPSSKWVVDSFSFHPSVLIITSNKRPNTLSTICPMCVLYVWVGSSRRSNKIVCLVRLLALRLFTSIVKRRITLDTPFYTPTT